MMTHKPHEKKDSTIKKRFVVSFGANILRSGISFITGILIARWLGPDEFGRMAFLLASFVAMRALLDMASSSAFFTFLSQKQRSRRFINFYWTWVGLQFFFSLLLLGLFLPESTIALIWKGEPRSLVVLAFIAAFMQNSVWSIASQMAEAQRETIKVERLNILIVLSHLSVVVALWWFGILAIPLLFLAIALEWGVAAAIGARLYHGKLDFVSEKETAKDTDTVTSTFREFWHYCLPLIPYAWLGFAYEFADRWMLQHWGGAEQQAYYAVAAQFAGVALLATTSILRIFWKEIAEAHYRQDYKQMYLLYSKASRFLFFTGALVAGGLLPWTKEIINLTLGVAYADGAVTMMLMLLYPVHQSMGQIGGTMLFATGKTKAYVLIGCFSAVLGIAVSYFMQAPSDALIPGLNLASQGLAYKMVLVQIVSVNVMAFFISRIFNWKYDWSYQIVGLGLAVLAGWVAKLIIFSWVDSIVLIAMALTGILYLSLMACIFYLLPWIAGMSRGQVNFYLRAIKTKIVSHSRF